MKTKFILLIILMGAMASLRAQEPLPGFAWAFQTGGDSALMARSVIVDSEGNQIITGFFNGQVDFNPGEGESLLTSNGYGDIFVQKLGPDGSFIWAYSMGDVNNDQGSEVIVDANDNIYVTGYFRGTIDADPGDGELLLYQDRLTTFIQKISPDMSLLWAKQFGIGNIGHAYGYAITLDNNMNLITVGTFYGLVDFDPGSGTFNLSANGTYDGFIQKLDNNGNFIWAKQIAGNTGSGSAAPYHVMADATGKIYTSGWFSDTKDFNPDKKLKYNLTSYGSTDGFIQALNSNGSFLWAKQIGSTDQDQIYGSILDPAGYIYSTGYFYATTDFDPGPGSFLLTPAGQCDIFLLKMDLSGNLAWAKQMGGIAGDVGHDLTIDGSGNVYTTGLFWSTADFDPGTGTYLLTSNGNNDAFVIKTDPSGNLLWVIQAGGDLNDWGLEVALDNAGNIFHVGNFDMTADFNPNGDGTYPMTNNGLIRDQFIQKLTPGGGSDCITPAGLGAVPGETSAELSWSTVNGVSGYFIRYRASDATEWTELPDLITNNYFALTGLTPYAGYSFQVKTSCPSNYSYSFDFFSGTPECDESAFEPNGTMVSAAPIPVNSNIYAQIAFTGDQDYFLFNTSANSKNIMITLTDLPADYNIVLYKSTGAQIGISTNTGTTPDSIVYNTSKYGSYVVRINGYSGVYDPIECYTLHVATSNTAFVKSAEAGLPDTPEANKINVYPNPARNNLSIDIVSGMAGNSSVRLINSSGQTLMEKEIKVTAGYTHTVLDASSLPTGIYFIRITTDKEVTVRKIVIQK